MNNTLRLYDSLTASTRTFEPAGDEVRLYVCGVTPYDTTHLGHAFTYVSFDVLVRYLRFLGHRVRYVQNVTDVDDPLFARAQVLGVRYDELAVQETARYFTDMAELNILPADVYPRASSELPAMIRMAQTLVDNGHAYLRDGRVYFKVRSDPKYGVLSKYDHDTMLAIARERGGDPDDPRKDEPLDFLLWRPSGPGEPAFDSPWGPGLPGWHLECSAMSLKYLGVPLDIHGGGSDLLFPHHESEIAQSEAASGSSPLARFWMHTAMVFMDGEKMSKSLGNMVFAHDLIEAYGADAVRIYISSVHYRSRLDWDPAEMEAAATKANLLATAARLPHGAGTPIPDVDAFERQFLSALSDDLNTPRALACLFEFGERMRTAHENGENIAQAQKVVGSLGALLGLTFSERAPVDV